MLGTCDRAQSRPFTEQWGHNLPQPCTMYGHCPIQLPKGPHLARRRHCNRYRTRLRCHGCHPVLARDVRCCRGVDFGRAGCTRAQTRSGGRRRARRGLRSGRRSFARYDASGGQRLHPQPAHGAAAVHRHVDKPDKLIPLLDIISVGIYAATGADKALVYGFAPVVCIMMGFFTAVGGGMLRDGFMGVVPGIFQRTNFYAIAAIAGSASYVCLVMSGLVSNVVALVVCVVVTMGLRWLSLRFDIKSPTEDDIARFLHRKK